MRSTAARPTQARLSQLTPELNAEEAEKKPPQPKKKPTRKKMVKRKKKGWTADLDVALWGSQGPDNPEKPKRKPKPAVAGPRLLGPDVHGSVATGTVNYRG